MNRFLVVGCGGSGGKTLAYLMDQLRSDLAKDGVHDLPPGWQFVFVDVPTAIESGPDGLGNVVQQGGRYVGMGRRGGSYADLDQTVSQMLTASQALETIGTWAPPRPEFVSTPISVGAGQYRAIGRMILLARAGEVQRTLEAAYSELARVETASAMEEASHKVGTKFQANKDPIIIVVASMAGGSGASMALDVCRLLTQVPRVNARLMSVFMVSADVFDSLPAADRSGVRANALAMLGEIVASQSGAARRHDVSLLGGLGYRDGTGEPVPFARVFPISRSMGTQGTIFGDGSMNTIYRGLARGLAGLMISDVASNQFIDYDLGNTGSRAANAKYLGWGAQPDPIPWGSFGFATLSMGRDRYAEYAAQRIARTSVDRLLKGHMQPGNPASSVEQVNALLDNQWPNVCLRLELPPGVGSQPGAELGSWMTTVALPRETAELMAQQVTDREFTPHVPPADGQSANQYRDALRFESARRRQPLIEAVTHSTYRWAHEWHRGLEERTLAVVEDAASRMGLPYADALVQRLSNHVKDLMVPGTQRLSRIDTGADVTELSDEVERVLSSAKGALNNGAAIMDNVVRGVMTKVRGQVYTRASGIMADGLRTFVTDVLQPLRDSLNEAQRILEQATGTQGSFDGLAQLATDQYRAWPSDQDTKVPKRFDEANNEVLITTTREFGDRYNSDLRAAIATEAGGADARAAVIPQVIKGQWVTAGGDKPPGGLLEVTSLWRSRAFPIDPVNGDAIVPSEARFDIHVRPRELLDRARRFVARKGESFDNFCSTSLRDYLSSVNVRESERDFRLRDVVSKFRATLSLAVPLISVDSQTVQLLHGTKVEYRYKFSAVPFLNLAITRDLEGIISSDDSIDSSSLDNFHRALTDQGNPRRIDVFGSYPLYSPLAFDSILSPVAQEWDATPPQGRAGYWNYRRARTLDAALAMSDAEREAMVAGWYLGQIAGEIRIPDPPYNTPVQIWDPERGTFRPFPHPLLTPPERFRKKYDWLAAVLESHLLAIAAVQKAPVMSSLRPYHLLRELYDNSELGPVGGIVEQSGLDKLTRWLLKGSVSGMPSRIPSLAKADTPETRRDAAKEWLMGAGGPSEVAKHFLVGRGANAFTATSAVMTREQAAATPFFRDLADDVDKATNRLAVLLDRAYASQQGQEAPGDEFAPRDDELPEGGVF